MKSFPEKYNYFKKLIDQELARSVPETEPESLYEPIHFVLSGGGKRIRPVLVLLGCEAVGGSARKALHAAAAIEILHNFTLVHDDIMDNASTRRGRPTVHTRWDSNVAILAGDDLVAVAYRQLLRTPVQNIGPIAEAFTQGLMDVCEGQAYDKDFETRSDVTLEEYLHMIEKKTGKLVSTSLNMGALIGAASNAQRRRLIRFGELIGQAFQIQDDLLDVVGDEKTFGKMIGGDIVEGKKTYLLINAYRKARGKDKQFLREIIANGGTSKRNVHLVRRIYEQTGTLEDTQKNIEETIASAKKELRGLPPTGARAMLGWLSDMLLHRKF